MELSVTVSLAINHREGDTIPVSLRNGVVVGYVKNVVQTFDGGNHVTVLVRDDIMRSAMIAHMDSGQPVFRIGFPRRQGDDRSWEELVDSRGLA